MFSSMTIKQKLWGFAFLSVAFSAAIAAAGYWGQQQIGAAMSDVMVNSAAQKNQMQADMMHDALRADVLAALLAGQKSEADRGEDAKRITSDLREHAKIFRERLDANEKLPLDATIKKALSESGSSSIHIYALQNPSWVWHLQMQWLVRPNTLSSKKHSKQSSP